MQIDDEENLTLIDFPQMVSVGHGNARELFYRDVECVIRCDLTPLLEEQSTQFGTGNIARWPS